MDNTENVYPFPTKSPQPKMRSLADQCRDDGIMLMYVFDRDNPVTGGFTLAFRPGRAYKSTKMVDVAVSYCSEGDRFDKKVGRELALRRFLNNEFISVPALRFGEDELHDELRRMFYHFVAY